MVHRIVEGIYVIDMPRKTIGLLSFIRKMQGRRLQEILVWMLQRVTLFIFSIQMTI